MPKTFVCSLCRRGILGGGLYLDENAVTYRTGKLTVDEKYRCLVLPLAEIRELSWKHIVFPIASFHMKNGEEYRIIIFNQPRFEKWYREYTAVRQEETE